MTDLLHKCQNPEWAAACIESLTAENAVLETENSRLVDAKAAELLEHEVIQSAATKELALQDTITALRATVEQLEKVIWTESDAPLLKRIAKLEKLLILTKCPVSDCDGNGTITNTRDTQPCGWSIDRATALQEPEHD